MSDEASAKKTFQGLPLFLSMVLTIFCLLLISFLEARQLLKQVVGGILLARLEKSLVLTHFVLLSAGLMIVFLLFRRFFRSYQGEKAEGSSSTKKFISEPK